MPTAAPDRPLDPTPRARLLHGLLLAPALALILGSAAAVSMARAGGGMGFDQIANALGGLMLGGSGGLVAGTLLARSLPARALRITTALVVLLAVGLVLFLSWRVRRA
jgi:hypothetical protein